MSRDRFVCASRYSKHEERNGETHGKVTVNAEIVRNRGVSEDSMHAINDETFDRCVIGWVTENRGCAIEHVIKHVGDAKGLVEVSVLYTIQ